MDQSPPSKTLEDFIGKLSDAGVESEGEFTLNPERARELLRSFQLDNPYRYILHLVSFMVGFHPPEINLTTTNSQGQHRITLTAAGVELAPEDLANPFLGLLRRGKGRHFEELAIGLNAATGIEGCAVVISSGKSIGSYAGDKIVTDTSQGHVEGTRIEILRPPTRKSQDEEAFVRQGFPHCPVPLVVNAVPISGNLECQPGDFEWHLHNPHDPLWLMPNEHRTVVSHTARFSALIQIGEVAPGLEIIHLGRSYLKTVPWALTGGGWRLRLTIATTRCKKDLSQLDILEEKTFHNLLNHIRNQFLDSLAQMLKPLSASPRPPSDFLDLVIDHAFQGGAKDQAYQMQREQYQRVKESKNLLHRATASYRLGLMERQRGNPNAETLIGAAAQDFASWRAPRDLWFEDFPVSPKVYAAWVQVRAHYYLGRHSEELAEQLFKHAFKARGCLPMEELSLRWALELDNGRGRAQERLRWGQVLHQLQRLEEARTVLEEAVRQAPSDGLKDPKIGWNITELLGQVCAELGHPKLAISHLSEVLEAKRDRYGNQSSELGLTLERLIVILEHTGDKQTAQHYRSWVASLV